MNSQDWRAFLQKIEAEDPSQVLRVEEEIDPAHEITAFMTEMEKQGPAPAVIFNRVEATFMDTV